MGSPDDFLKWQTTLNEQNNNNGFAVNYEMVMNLAQAMLVGRSLDAFVKDRRAKEVKNLTLLDKKKTELTPQHIYDYAIFEFAIRAFDTQSDWRDTSERQHEYMQRDLFMGNLNHEKFSQRLQEMNRCLDVIPIEKSTGKETNPIVKAYDKAFPDDEIISIMGRAIPPEWAVNLALEIQIF
jgi:hypothetical protein